MRRNFFEYLFEKVNSFYEKLFYNYGLFISKYHLYTISCAFLLNLMLTICVMRLKMVTDTDELYIVQNSRAKYDEGIIKELFNETNQLENKYYMHQASDLGSYAEINFHVASDPKGNIIKKEYFDEILRVHNAIMEHVKFTDEKTNKTYTYYDVCARRSKKTCALEGVGLLNSAFFEHLKTTVQEIQSKEQDSDDSENIDGEDVETQYTKIFNNLQPYFSIETNTFSFLKFNLGKDFRYITTAKKNQTEYAYARLFKLRYSLKSSFTNMDPFVQKWEIEFLKFMKNLKTNLTTFLYSTSKSLDYEIEENMSPDFYLVGTTFTMITVFATVLMSYKSNVVTSPGLILPFSGIMSAFFGLTSSIGLMSIIGYEGCSLIFVIPFLVLGIGIDDMFIVYSEFTHTSKDLATPERIAETLKKSGVSITITSLTDFVAFLVGVSAGFRSVQIFCIYAAFSILFCYFYQLTIFTGFLVIHSNRIKQNRHTIFWWIKKESMENSETKDETKDDRILGVELNEYKENNALKCEEKIVNTRGEKSWGKSKKSCFDKFLRKWKKIYYYLIVETTGKCIVGVIFLIYISLSGWQAYSIREGIDIGDLVSDDSYFRAYFKDNSEVIDLNPFVMLTFYKPLNYSSRKTRAEINKFIKDVHSIEGISKEFLFDWTEAFHEQLDMYSKTGNDSYLHQMADDMMPFSNDIVLKTNPVTNRTEIAASRIYIQYEKLVFSSADAVPMTKLRDLCEKSDLPVFAYAISFKYYEQFEQTMPNIVQSFVIAIEAMYLISLLFVPDLTSTIAILSSMLSIMVGLMGCMHAWGLTLSSVTMIQLVMSIGFCVDFSVHVTHAFITGVGTGSRGVRAYKACMRTGVPVFNSALSTIIGILVLAFCKSYIFTAFFKSVFILMLLGVLNSMLFLPVLLSLIGPHWKRHSTDQILRADNNCSDAAQNIFTKSELNSK